MGNSSTEEVQPREKSNLDWGVFFPSPARILVLPPWAPSRLLFSGESPSRRWRRSAAFPAYKPRARALRVALRLAAAVGCLPRFHVTRTDWVLRSFLSDLLPTCTGVSLLLGTPAGSERATIQCWGEDDTVLAYLKFSRLGVAGRDLRHEHSLLAELSSDLGPRVLKFGPCHDGHGLLLTPLDGRRVPACLPPPPDVTGFVERLVLPGRTFPIAEHPWIVSTIDAAHVHWRPDRLAGMAWPLAIQHGDLAPWNMVRGDDGVTRAFDWEFGTSRGFPHVDLAQYILQVAALIYRWSPRRASEYAVSFLIRDNALSLTPDQATAVTFLAAHDAHRRQERLRDESSRELQQWRREVMRATA